MRKSLSTINSICRLLTLLLIVPLCSEGKSLQRFHFPPNSNILNVSESSKFSENQGLNSERYYLWNFCSRQFMRIKRPGRRGVDARGKKSDPRSIVVIESVATGIVRFRSENNLYLCFNRNGSLRVQRHHKGFCYFKQNITTDGYDEFSLHLNDNWFIGFRGRKIGRNRKIRRNGRPLRGLKGNKSKKMKECYKFMADRVDKLVTTTRPPFPFDWNKNPEYDPEGNGIRKTMRHRLNRKRHNRKRERRKNRRRNKKLIKPINR